MSTLCSLINCLVFIQVVTCRDFYLGMFRRNDFLVAQDVIYKAPAPFGYTTANYGRVFKCPITYFRVVDRLGMGRGPITTIVRGGLRKKFITVRIKSTYRLPVSVNIYVGCENKKPSTLRTTLTTTVTTTTKAGDVTTDDDAADKDAITVSGGTGDDKSATDGPTIAGTDEDGDNEATTTAGSDVATTNEGTENVTPSDKTAETKNEITVTTEEIATTLETQ